MDLFIKPLTTHGCLWRIIFGHHSNLLSPLLGLLAARLWVECYTGRFSYSHLSVDRFRQWRTVSPLLRSTFREMRNRCFGLMLENPQGKLSPAKLGHECWLNSKVLDNRWEFHPKMKKPACAGFFMRFSFSCQVVPLRDDVPSGISWCFHFRGRGAKCGLLMDCSKVVLASSSPSLLYI